jgi:hypothetical protein
MNEEEGRMKMNETEIRNKKILTNRWGGNSQAYRGILEIMARFGFASAAEAVYGFDLTRKQANKRFAYLESAGLIRRFPSFVLPENFFSLTALGAQFVRANQISDEVIPFDPLRYKVSTQHHTRTVARTYLALKKIFGPDLEGWISERSLLSDAWSQAADKRTPPRVLDGMFNIKIQGAGGLARTGRTGVPLNGSGAESWWSGLELELTLKSTPRYRKQFRDLSYEVYDEFADKQTIPLMLYLSGATSIQKKLIEIWESEARTFGRCRFVFGQVDDFLRDLGSASLVQCVGRTKTAIYARELSQGQVMQPC